MDNTIINVIENNITTLSTTNEITNITSIIDSATIINETIDETHVITTNNDITIINNVVDNNPTIIKELERGEQGIQGKSAYQIAIDNGFIGTEQEWLNSLKASPNIISILSNTNIGGNRVVVLENNELIYADNNNINHANKILGLTLTSVTPNNYVNILTIGEMNGFYNLIIGEPIYLINNGLITQTLPNSGFIIQLGTALKQDTIYINCKMPIVIL